MDTLLWASTVMLNGMAEIAGMDNDGVSQCGRHIDERVKRFHKVKLSGRVIIAQTAQDHLKAYVLCNTEGIRA